MEEILERLDKVRRYGDSYRALCPVHGGDNHSALKLTHKEGKVLLHCFACGASAKEIMDSLNLSMDLLFDEKREFVRDPNWMLKKTQMQDDTLILIAQAAEERGERLKYGDRTGLQLALARRDQRKAKGIDQVDLYMDIRPYGV